jgi:hypothetical protein
MEQCCGPLTLEMNPGNTAISALILPRERELSLALAHRCSLLIMEQCCGHLAVEMVPGMQESTAISAPILPRERSSFGACAEVQFPDYGTDLWAPGIRNEPKKALRFQHLFCQECESSVWSMRRVCCFLIMKQSCVPLAVDIDPRKHCDFST